ncbi:hypothetical protein D3C81_1862710 [compost metagenome]
MPLPPLACQFDRRFAGFTATVEQVRLITAGTGAQSLGEVEHAAVMQAETGVDQQPGLRREGIDQCRRAVSEAIGAPTLGEIQIRALIAVPQPGTLAAHKNLFRPVDTGHQALAGEVVALGR